MEQHTKEGRQAVTVYKRKLAKLSRWLHIYLSMVSFTIVLFFSVTGLTLNHADYFQGQTKTRQQKGKLPVEWVNVADTNRVARLSIAEYFRNRFAVKGAVNDFRIEDAQVSLAFKGPGYEAAIFIDRKTGEFDMAESSTGFIGFVNDLHKGRDTGKTWAWVIDIAAVLMTLISLTGLILLLFIKRKRINGMLLLVAGTVIIYLLYKIWGQ
jgi:hypothetical protein